jgi:hypothetical protein
MNNKQRNKIHTRWLKNKTNESQYITQKIRARFDKDNDKGKRETSRDKDRQTKTLDNDKGKK